MEVAPGRDASRVPTTCRMLGTRRTTRSTRSTRSARSATNAPAVGNEGDADDDEVEAVPRIPEEAQPVHEQLRQQLRYEHHQGDPVDGAQCVAVAVEQRWGSLGAQRHRVDQDDAQDHVMEMRRLHQPLDPGARRQRRPLPPPLGGPHCNPPLLPPSATLATIAADRPAKCPPPCPPAGRIIFDRLADGQRPS